MLTCCAGLHHNMPPPRPGTVLALYRSILRCHRDKLPEPIRPMGDEYARDEFKRHWKEKTTPAQWETFMAEWQRYLDMLEGRGDPRERSGSLDPDLLGGMTDEQRVRLDELREEIHESVHREPPPEK